MPDAMSEALLELGEMIALAQSDAVLGHHVTHGELTVTATPSGLRALVGYLRDNAACAFTTMIDITAVDWPGRDDRFDVVYHFLSMPQNQRVRVKLSVAEDEMVPSISDIHPSANWFEREVFDMYGVMFTGHPDLRRILPVRLHEPVGGREIHPSGRREAQLEDGGLSDGRHQADRRTAHSQLQH
jgi:NADH-quinone oxidoreductase subunit C